MSRPVYVDINICKYRPQEKRHCDKEETCPTSRVKSLITERLELFKTSVRCLRPFLSLVQLLDETGCFDFLNQAWVDEQTWIGAGGFGFARGDVVEHGFYAVGCR